MAVYTHVSRSELDAYLALYDLGALRGYRGVEQGVENTNYILEVEGANGAPAKYVLTLFEKRVKPADLPFYLDAMDFFAGRAAPAPRVAPTRAGARIGTLCGRPSAIITFLEGAPHLGEVLALANVLELALDDQRELVARVGGYCVGRAEVDGVCDCPLGFAFGAGEQY